MSAWWLDLEVDWSSGDPLRVVQLLAAAYPTHSQAKRVIHQVGLESNGASSDAATGETLWLRAVTIAARDGKTLDLAAAVLGDADASAFHTPLRQMLGPQLAKLVYRLGIPSEGAVEVLEALSADRPAATEDPIEGFEAISSPPSGLQDTHAFIRVEESATQVEVLFTGALDDERLFVDGEPVEAGRRHPGFRRRGTAPRLARRCAVSMSPRLTAATVRSSRSSIGSVGLGGPIGLAHEWGRARRSRRRRRRGDLSCCEHPTP